VVERFEGDLDGEGSLKTLIIGGLEKGEIFCSGKMTG